MNTFIRNTLNLLGATLVAALVLVGCASPESNKDDDSASGPVVTVPTTADLVGTWKLTSTYEKSREDDDGNEYTVTITGKTTWVFASDGTYSRLEDETITPKDSPNDAEQDVNEYEGTYSVTNGSLRTESERFRSVDASGEGTWFPQVEVTADFAILSNGELFLSQLFKAQGNVSGIVGKWVNLNFYEFRSEPVYEQRTYTFTSDKTVTHSRVTSTDSTFDENDTVEGEGSGEYALSDNKINFLADGEVVGSAYYKLVDGYLIVDFDKSPTGFIKQ